jgi:hypothetical protein
VSPEVAVWWRDDDAGRHDARLDRLLELATGGGRQLGLAVVPAWLDDATTARVLAAPTVHVMQHGWAHADHALPGAKPVELGGAADRMTCADELRRGASRLRGAFGGRFLPVMVPPWNRIETSFLGALPGLGYRGLSTFADDRRGTARGLVHVNTHVDLIDWRGTRRMKPLGDLIGEVDRLLARPDCRMLGLLSHHLEMSLDEMARLRQLFTHVDELERCRWADLPSLFMPR